MLNRRDLLTRGVAGSAVLLAPSQLFAEFLRSRPSQVAGRPWLAAALKAERWLAASAQPGPNGIAWPADPTVPTSVSTDLYNGMAGVVLFYLELHNATKDANALTMARGGADYLLSTLPDEPGNAPMGLYTGLAGTATVLGITYQATRDARYQEGVRKALALIARAAKPAGSGVEWNDSTDIVSGSAGIGLTLLAWGGENRAIDARKLAGEAGNRLIERAQTSDQGLSWLIQPGMPRNYPNFSHGTAGVSFYLALLSTSRSGRNISRRPWRVNAGCNRA